VLKSICRRPIPVKKVVVIPPVDDLWQTPRKLLLEKKSKAFGVDVMPFGANLKESLDAHFTCPHRSGDKNKLLLRVVLQ
jgi:hypothetical protein